MCGFREVVGASREVEVGTLETRGGRIEGALTAYTEAAGFCSLFPMGTFGFSSSSGGKIV